MRSEQGSSARLTNWVSGRQRDFGFADKSNRLIASIFCFPRRKILKVWPPVGKPRRGPPPVKTQEAIANLRRYVKERHRPFEALLSMPEKELVQICGKVSRETARKARDAILSEFPQANSDNK